MVIITDVIFTEDFPTSIAFQRKEVWEKNKKRKTDSHRAELTAVRVLAKDYK